MHACWVGRQHPHACYKVCTMCLCVLRSSFFGHGLVVPQELWVQILQHGSQQATSVCLRPGVLQAGQAPYRAAQANEALHRVLLVRWVCLLAHSAAWALPLLCIITGASKPCLTACWWRQRRSLFHSSISVWEVVCCVFRRWTT